MHNSNNNNNVPVGSRSLTNQRRFLVLKVIFAVAVVILFFSLFHVVSLRSQITDLQKKDKDDNQDGDENGAEQKQQNPAMKKQSFLTNIFSANKKKNLVQTESYSEYSRKAFSSFPSKNDLPSMRQHILHLQVSLQQDDTNETKRTNENNFVDEKGAIIIQQNASEDEVKMRRRISSLSRIQEMAKSISQKVLRDDGGRKVPNIVGNPVADVKHGQKKGKMHDILNGNHKTKNEALLRVFSVQPTISGELDWIPDFVHTDKGNILFKDQLGRRNNVDWFVAEVRHEGKPVWPTRFLLLHELGLTNNVFKFFQKELAFERENKNNVNDDKEDHHKKNRKEESSLSFFTDANNLLINKNPSLELRENLEAARIKIVSVLGMNPNVLDRSFLVSAVANSPQKTNENGEENGDGDGNAVADKERQVPIDIATNLYDQIELIVRSLQPAHAKSSGKKKAAESHSDKTGSKGEDNDASTSSHDNNEENDDDGHEDYDGQVVAVSVSSLYKNSEKNDAVIIYLKDQKMKNLPDEMLEDHSIKILTDFIVGNPESMKNSINIVGGDEQKNNNSNENNNIVGEDDGGVVIRNFLVMCATAKAENK